MKPNQNLDFRILNYIAVSCDKVEGVAGGRSTFIKLLVIWYILMMGEGQG